jgi:hypothetical protein
VAMMIMMMTMIMMTIIISRATHNELKWKICGEKWVFHILSFSILPTSVVDSTGTFRVLARTSNVVVLILADRRGYQGYFE